MGIMAFLTMKIKVKFFYKAVLKISQSKDILSVEWVAFL